MDVSYRRLLGAALVATLPLHAAAATGYKLAFGPGKAPAGFTQVALDARYDAMRGYGFEPGGAQASYFSSISPKVITRSPSPWATTRRPRRPRSNPNCAG